MLLLLWMFRDKRGFPCGSSIETISAFAGHNLRPDGQSALIGGCGLANNRRPDRANVLKSDTGGN
jgi:hypothetical protein